MIPNFVVFKTPSAFSNQSKFLNPNCTEFLLGNDLLVAPVLDEGAVTRDIYLPTGAWRDEANPEHPVYNGPIWIREENFSTFSDYMNL